MTIPIYTWANVTIIGSDNDAISLPLRAFIWTDADFSIEHQGDKLKWNNTYDWICWPYDAGNLIIAKLAWTWGCGSRPLSPDCPESWCAYTMIQIFRLLDILSTYVIIFKQFCIVESRYNESVWNSLCVIKHNFHRTKLRHANKRHNLRIDTNGLQNRSCLQLQQEILFPEILFACGKEQISSMVFNNFV